MVIGHRIHLFLVLVVLLLISEQQCLRYFYYLVLGLIGYDYYNVIVTSSEDEARIIIITHFVFLPYSTLQSEVKD